MFGILVACLPAFRPFLARFAQNKFSSAVSAQLRKLKTRKRAGSGKDTHGYLHDDQNSAWPPGSEPGQSWTMVAYGAGVDSSSTDGLHPAPAYAIEYPHQHQHYQMTAASEAQRSQSYDIFGGQPYFPVKSSGQITLYP